MKYLWFEFMEAKHNKAVILLIIVQFIFSMTCWQLAYSVTKNYLYLSHRLSQDYKYSVRVLTGETTSDDIAEVTSYDDGIKGFGVNYYHCTVESDDLISMIDIGLYTKETFTDFDFDYSGEKLDTEKDYDAIPTYVSSELSQTYKKGEYVTTTIGTFYICGYLKDKSLFYMSQNDTMNTFFAAYDKDGIVAESGETPIRGTAFFTSSDKSVYDIPFSGLMESVKKTSKPNWSSELSGAFSEISGFLIISVWVMVISLIGLFSNNMLTFENNRQSHAVQLLMGCKKSRIIGIYVWRMICAMIIAIPITIEIFNLLKTKYDKLVFSYETVLFSLAVGLVVSLISVLFIMFKFSRVDIVSDMNK